VPPKNKRGEEKKKKRPNPKTELSSPKDARTIRKKKKNAGGGTNPVQKKEKGNRRGEKRLGKEKRYQSWCGDANLKKTPKKRK